MLRLGFSGRFQLLGFNLFCVSFSLGSIKYLCLLFLDSTFPSFFLLKLVCTECFLFVLLATQRALIQNPDCHYL